MKIIKIGTFDQKGMPIGWHFDMEGAHQCSAFSICDSDTIWSPAIELWDDGRVSLNGIEIVEWTEARKTAMEKI